MSDRAFFVDVGKYNVDRMLEEWRWLVTPDQTPLFVSVLADWVFGAPDGSLWALSTLEGDYRQVAVDAAEYNRQKRSVEWLEANFAAGWQPIAAGNGLLPNENECLGWKLHPVLGGAFEAASRPLRRRSCRTLGPASEVGGPPSDGRRLRVVLCHHGRGNARLR